jgi:osomolarity two-component system, sensor histidine kinase SLN1
MTDTTSGRSTAAQKIEESSLVNGVLPVPVLQSNVISTVRRRGRRFSPFQSLSGLWTMFVKRLGTRTVPSTSSARASESHHDHICPNREDDDDEVDDIIVDRMWSDGFKTSDLQSDHGGSPEKSSGSQRGSHRPPSIETFQFPNGFWTTCFPLTLIRFRIWPAVVNFFNSKFSDAESETQYQTENWYIRKVIFDPHYTSFYLRTVESRSLYYRLFF